MHTDHQSNGHKKKRNRNDKGMSSRHQPTSHASEVNFLQNHLHLHRLFSTVLLYNTILYLFNIIYFSQRPPQRQDVERVVRRRKAAGSFSRRFGQLSCGDLGGGLRAKKFAENQHPPKYRH